MFLGIIFCLSMSGETTVPMKIVNNSEFADNEIYVAIIGRSGDQWIYYDLKSNFEGNVSLPPLEESLNTLHKTPSDWGHADIFVTLDKLSDKTIHIAQTYSCRLFIGFKSPMYIHAFGPDRGFAGADMNNPADPNANIRWEISEFTYDKHNVFFINTTRVDAFQYPMGVELYGTQSSNNAYMKRGETQSYKSIIERWKTDFANSEFINCYSEPITADVLGGIIKQPSKVMEIKDNGYFDDYIDRIWKYFTDNELYADMGQLGRWRGRVDFMTNRFTMTRESDNVTAYIYSKPTTIDAIEGAGEFAKGSEADKSLQAMFCGAINRGVIDLSTGNGVLQEWGDKSKFFRTDVCNLYVKFFHQPDISHEGYTYAFAYDDTFDQSSTCATSNPDHAVVTIGGFHESGIPSIIISASEDTSPCKYGIYTLSGVKIRQDKSSLNSLPAGVYIVNGNKIAVK